MCNNTATSVDSWLLKSAMAVVLGVGMMTVIASDSGWIKGALSQDSGLQFDYYARQCPNAEAIVSQTLLATLPQDVTAPAALLRLAFHDCQVQGCDASVTLQSTSTFQSEMVADKSFGIRRLDFIDRIKAAVEAACPGRVSCGDIIVLAARDSVALSGGPRIRIRTGRRDGLTASNRLADTQLPSPLINVDGLLRVFQPTGMSIEESIAIVGGGHSLGIGHCVSFINRLYPQLDPTLNPLLANALLALCPTPNIFAVTNITFFDNDLTNIIFDNQYFGNLQGGGGLFTIDSEIAQDSRSKGIVANFAANQNYFFQTFTSAFSEAHVIPSTDWLSR